jgi:mRNA interferase RelE/StbE
MEQGSQEKKVEYMVLWTADSREDLDEVPEDVAETIIEKVGQRLSRLPHFVGQPLKGTVKKLWKLRFGKYRLVYSINTKYKEVYILAITNRDVVYRNDAIQSLLRLAVALHERSKEGGL